MKLFERKKKQVAKFQFSAVLISAVVGMVIVAIIATFGQDIMGDIKDDQTAGSYEYNSTAFGQQGVDNMAKKFPTLGTVVIAGILIITLIGFLAVRKGA